MILYVSESKTMAKTPFFSVVIPTYNRISDLRFALFCLLRQTFANFEIIISDNCSIDGTQASIKSINDKRIRYFRNKTTVKEAVNESKAIKKAKGKYVFLHADDDFLMYKNSLKEVHDEISKYHPGFIRLNYFSLSLGKNRIFKFGFNKHLTTDKYLPPHKNFDHILDFINDVDQYFVTGIIFKNDLPKTIGIIDTDPCPWINILLYQINKSGALFLYKQYIIASWSRRKKKKTDQHHFFNITNNELRSKKYLDAVKEKASKDFYQTYLHHELMKFYVDLFPVIKVNTNNQTVLDIAKKVYYLDPSMSRTIKYWSYLIIALITPRLLLRLTRDIYLVAYSNLSKIRNEKDIINILNSLEKEYSEKIFNFSY